VFVILFSILAFFSHTLLDERPFVAMFGFLGAVAYLECAEPFLSRSSLPKA
jgi:hypothetical protein